MIVPPALPRDFLHEATSGEQKEDRLDAELVIGFPARLVAVKRPDRLLHWVQALAAERRVHLVVAGDGPLKSEMVALAKSLAIDAHISWRGQVRDMRAFYRQVDVVALTSQMEGTPLALLEAMAMGCSVVATDVGGVADIVRDDGLLLPPPESAAGWARRFLDWWEDGTARTRMAAAAQSRVRQEQTPERLIQDVDRLYREAATAAGLG